jgi:hypothetical protein
MANTADTFDLAITGSLAALLEAQGGEEENDEEIPPVIKAVYYNQVDLLNSTGDAILLIELSDEQFAPTGANSRQAITQVAEIRVILKLGKNSLDESKAQCAATAGLVQDEILKNPRLDSFLVCAGKFFNSEHGQVMIKDKKAVYVCLFYQGKYFRGGAV